MKYTKYILLVLVSVYCVFYIKESFNPYVELTMGLLIFFTLPLSVVQFALAAWCFNRNLQWSKIVSAVGIVIAIITLIHQPLIWTFL